MTNFPWALGNATDTQGTPTEWLLCWGGDRDVPRDRTHHLPCWAGCAACQARGFHRDQGGLFLGLPLPPTDPFHTLSRSSSRWSTWTGAGEKLPLPPQQAQFQGQCSPAPLGQATLELFSASAGQGLRQTHVSFYFAS